MRYSTLCSLLLLITVGTIRAQTTGTLAGKVLDSAEKGIAGARVILVGTLPPRGAITKADGSYLITGVRAGQYALTVTALGFQTRQRDTVNIVINQERRVNVMLGVAPVVAPLVRVRENAIAPNPPLDSLSRLSVRDAVMQAARDRSSQNRQNGEWRARPSETSIRVDGIPTADSTKPAGPNSTP